MKRLPLFALVGLLTIAAAALAAIPVGGEIAVNTTTTSTQEDPAIAIDGGGAFTVAWQSDNAGQDDIGLRRFAADGTPLSSEVLFGDADDEDDVAVATAANGNGVVVYDDDTAADGEEVRAKLFAASPFSVGATEIAVNAETTGNQEQAAVAMDADGDFVVAWLNPDNEEAGDGVNARLYDETGAPQGGEIEVNTGVIDDQDRPSVAMDAAGNFVIAWESDAQDDVGSNDGVYAQRFNAAGAPQGAEMAVNQTTAGDQRRPAVAMDTDGDFAIVWQGSGPGDADGVFVRRYNAAGTPGTDELRANETTDGSQGDRPAVAMDSDGDFAVTWEGNGAGDADGVFVRDFTAAGAPLAGELLVNSSHGGGADAARGRRRLGRGHGRRLAERGARRHGRLRPPLRAQQPGRTRPRTWTWARTGPRGARDLGSEAQGHPEGRERKRAVSCG